MAVHIFTINIGKYQFILIFISTRCDQYGKFLLVFWGKFITFSFNFFPVYCWNFLYLFTTWISFSIKLLFIFFALFCWMFFPLFICILGTLISWQSYPLQKSPQSVFAYIFSHMKIFRRSITAQLYKCSDSFLTYLSFYLQLEFYIYNLFLYTV